MKILDYGAGWGRFALAMRACGCQVHVFEFAQDRAQSARDNGLTVTLTAEMAGQSYDFINTEQVFEHLPEPRETAMLLHSALDRQGVLKISVPFARWAETGRIEIDWTAGRYSKNSGTPFHPLEHLTYFRRPSLQLMAQDLGMTEMRHQAYEQLGYSFDWIGLRSAARNLARLLPRRWFRNYFFFVKE